MRRSVFGLVAALFWIASNTALVYGQSTSRQEHHASRRQQPVSELLTARNGVSTTASGVPDSKLPMTITGGKLLIKEAGHVQTAVLEGSVKVTQGDVTLTCDKLEIEYDGKNAKSGRDSRNGSKQIPLDLQKNSEMKSITASGNVKVAQGKRMALAGKAIFDNAKRTITLSGNPKVWQGSDRLSGEKIVIYLDENSFEVLPGEGSDKKQVEIIINNPGGGGNKKEQEK